MGMFSMQEKLEVQSQGQVHARVHVHAQVLYEGQYIKVVLNAPQILIAADSDLVHSPLVVTLAGVRRLPPTELGTGCLGFIRKVDMDKPVSKRRST